MPVRFFSEEIPFKILHPRKSARWIEMALKREKARLGDINYIFCGDQYLLQVNREYLKHNTLTDIITFDTGSPESKAISGDVFISIDRVRDNAASFGTSFDNEIHRVMIHGILHLLGYKDKTPGDKALMRKKEEAYLSLRN